MTVLSKHYVTFYSPGTFTAEQSTELVESWDVEAATNRASTVHERHGATPYGFRFTTRGRGEADLDSREIARSNFYYLGSKVETLEEVEARNDPKESILLGNMRRNGYSRIIVNDNSWRWTQPLEDDDVVLDFTLPDRARPPAESNASSPSEASAGKDALDDKKHPEPKEMK